MKPNKEDEDEKNPSKTNQYFTRHYKFKDKKGYTQKL
jgi:hypothetical protein